MESLNVGVVPSNLCPLCGFAEHEGRCERFSSIRWWCAHCLTTKITTSELAGPLISGELLTQVGINRTTKFCRLCAMPICTEHLTPLKKPPFQKCHVACQDFTESDEKKFVLTLDKYVPDWRTCGPHRCLVCNRPSVVHGMCARHFGQARSGRRPKLVVQKINRRRPNGVAKLVVHLTPELAESIRRLALEEGTTVSAFIEDCITAEFRRRLALLKRAAARQERGGQGDLK